MSNLRRGTFVAIAAAGLTMGASTIAAADTGSASSGSAGYFGNPVCILNTLLTYGTLSAGDAATYLPGCGPF